VARRVLSLDLGGTKLAVGVVNDAGEALAERLRLTPAQTSPAQVIQALLDMAEEAVQEVESGWSGLAGVGISFGGPVDFAAGRTLTCHHLPGWESIPLRDEVADRLGLPAIMDNDANVAALGEARFGAARGRRHVLYLTVSTGIGGGLVLDGRPYRGAHSQAGEIGHIIIAPTGPPCTCGRRGCLEALASGPAIARAAREALRAGEASSLAALPRGELTARDVAQAADAGDELARGIMHAAGEALGVAIAAAANLLDPDIVVIGGGVSQAGDLLLAPAREALAAHAVTDIARRIEVVPGQLGPRGALLGAAALALDML